MKTLKKIVLAVVMCAMLVMPFASTASAQDLVDPDNINSIAKYFGIDLSDPESINKAINDLRENGLSGLMSLLGIDVSDILDELQKYMIQMDMVTTAPATTEPTTEEPTTEEPTTEAPTTSAPIYAPTYPSYTAPTTQPTTQIETTTFQFIPPEQVYTEAYTTTVFQPVVEDDVNLKDDTNPVKTGIGAILLLGSGVGVVIVVLALKRNRI